MTDTVKVMRNEAQIKNTLQKMYELRLRAYQIAVSINFQFKFDKEQNKYVSLKNSGYDSVLEQFNRHHHEVQVAKQQNLLVTDYSRLKIKFTDLTQGLILLKCENQTDLVQQIIYAMRFLEILSELIEVQSKLNLHSEDSTYEFNIRYSRLLLTLSYPDNIVFSNSDEDEDEDEEQAHSIYTQNALAAALMLDGDLNNMIAEIIASYEQETHKFGGSIKRFRYQSIRQQQIEKLKNAIKANSVYSAADKMAVVLEIYRDLMRESAPQAVTMTNSDNRPANLIKARYFKSPSQLQSSIERVFNAKGVDLADYTHVSEQTMHLESIEKTLLDLENGIEATGLFCHELTALIKETEAGFEEELPKNDDPELFAAPVNFDRLIGVIRTLRNELDDRIPQLCSLPFDLHNESAINMQKEYLQKGREAHQKLCLYQKIFVTLMETRMYDMDAFNSDPIKNSTHIFFMGKNNNGVANHLEKDIDQMINNVLKNYKKITESESYFSRRRFIARRSGQISSLQHVAQSKIPALEKLNQVLFVYQSLQNEKGLFSEKTRLFYKTSRFQTLLEMEFIKKGVVLRNCLDTAGPVVNQVRAFKI